MAAFMQFSIANRGGNLSVPKLSAEVLMDTIPLMEFDNPIHLTDADIGPGESKTLHIDRFSNLTDTTSSPLVESGVVPTTDFTIDRTTLTVDTYGLAVDYTEDVEVYGTLKITPRVKTLLGRNYKRTFDILAANQFLATQVRYVPTGTAAAPTSSFTTTGVFSGAATRDVQVFDIDEVVAYLESVLFAEPFDDGTFHCIANREFIKQIMRDTRFRDNFQHTTATPFVRNEIGTYMGVRYFRDNYQLPRVLGGTAFQAPAVFFGKDYVFKGQVTAPEIRYNPGTESYNLNRGLAWIWRGGYVISYDTGAAGQARGVRVGST